MPQVDTSRVRSGGFRPTLKQISVHMNSLFSLGGVAWSTLYLGLACPAILNGANGADIGGLTKHHKFRHPSLDVQCLLPMVSQSGLQIAFLEARGYPTSDLGMLTLGHSILVDQNSDLSGKRGHFEAILAQYEVNYQEEFYGSTQVRIERSW